MKQILHKYIRTKVNDFSSMNLFEARIFTEYLNGESLGCSFESLMDKSINSLKVFTSSAENFFFFKNFVEYSLKLLTQSASMGVGSSMIFVFLGLSRR